MIKYLKIKRTDKIRKKSGIKATYIFYMEKDSKKGNVIQERSISIKKSILVCGKAASGKTRWIRRMMINAPQIWTKIQEPVILIEANETITEWQEQQQVRNWWQRENPEKEWRRLRVSEKKKVLLQYVKQNWTVVFIDDTERLNGRKLDLVKEMLTQSKSKIWVCSAIAENRINPSLRNFITKSNPQTFVLNSPVAYDATNALTITICMFCVIIGWYPAAIAIGGVRMLSKGMFSTKQQ